MFRSSLLGFAFLFLLSSVALSAPDDWLGAPPKPLTPIETQRALLGTPTDDSGARIYRVDLDFSQIAPSYVFSSDGKYLFLLQRKVGLLQIEMPSFQLVRTLPLPCDGGSIALSREGLVVGSDEPKTVWIVNPQSLRVTRSFQVEQARFVTATPRSSLIFLGDGQKKLCSLDARSGEAVNYNVESFQLDIRTPDGHRTQALSSFASPVISPDGDALYCSSEAFICRFAIKGRTLTPDYNSDSLGSPFNPRGIPLVMSPDGHYIALINGSYGFGGDGFGTGRSPKPGEIWIFKTSNLREPLLRLEETSNARSLGFDATAQRLYIVGQRGFPLSLLIYSSQGTPLKALRFPSKNNGFGNNGPEWWGTDRPASWPGGGWSNGTPIAVYPQGNHVLVGGDSGLYWFDLPTAFTTPPSPTPGTPRRWEDRNRDNGDGFGQGGFGQNGVQF
ncbi:hypothetical protein IAD21_05779 [Abditibacteriota bacterium]|nr:hypothetical protein IAD21_05779 [Abditibacteriota bacterium]